MLIPFPLIAIVLQTGLLEAPSYPLVSNLFAVVAELYIIDQEG